MEMQPLASGAGGKRRTKPGQGRHVGTDRCHRGAGFPGSYPALGAEQAGGTGLGQPGALLVWFLWGHTGLKSQV